MKSFVIGISILLMSFNVFDDCKNNKLTKSIMNEYEMEWAKIDSLDRAQLPKSALSEVERLYTKVKAADDIDQLLKCIIYRNKYLLITNDGDNTDAITNLKEQLIAEASPQVKAIIQSMLAELYFLYAQSNRYALSNRSFVAENNPSDLKTWSIEALIRKSNQLYLSSTVQQFERQHDFEDYKAVMSELAPELGFKPDLNSILFHRMARHFANSQSLLTEPSVVFELNEEAYFNNLQSFVKIEVDSADSLSSKYLAVKGYQRYLSFLVNNGDKPELSFIDLERLQFIHNKSTLENKDQHYLSRLHELLELNKDQAIYSEISYHIAKFYFNEGKKYLHDFDSEYKGLIDKAHGIAAAAVERFPASYGAQNCQQLLAQIERKELNVQMESVVPSKQNFLMGVQFRNLSLLEYNIYKLSTVEKKKFKKTNYNDKLGLIKSWTADKTKLVELTTSDKDYHRTELILEALPYGEYVIVVSDDIQNFDTAKSQFAQFTISDLAYATQNSDQKLTVVVVDRVTGKPLERVQVDCYKMDRHERQSRGVLAKTLYTNRNGIAEYFGKNEELHLDLRYKGDQLSPDHSHGVYDQHDNRSHRVHHLFTDRNIYRPGQVVYFKGLLLENDESSVPSILSNEKISVKLNDANGQEIQEMDFVSNEFGTYNGHFNLPSSGLTGVFSFNITSGKNSFYESIRVEEYKRPKFEVLLDTLTTEYKLGDTVALTGQAKMFAGVPLDNASIKYNISREVHYPYWYWRRPINRTSQQIANGVIESAEDGTFELQVPLTSPSRSNSDVQPIFHYSITVDVVDITGETQSATTTIKASSKSIFTRLDLKPEVDKSSLRSVKLITENVNQKSISAKGIIRVEKLHSPSKFEKKRRWIKSDIFLYTEEEFDRYLPYDQYIVTRGYDGLAVEKEILQSGFDTNISAVTAALQNLSAGVYKISISTGDVTSKQYIKVTDFENDDVPVDQLVYEHKLKPSYAPGEEVSYSLINSSETSYVLFEVEKQGEIKTRKWLKLDKALEEKIEVKEDDRGGFYLHLTYFYQNRKFQISHKINVPWTNKDLKIEYLSMRSDVIPGGDESWQIKISGSQKDNLTAEMLTTMYDASLDQFAGPNEWQKQFYPNSYASKRWQVVGYRLSYFRDLTYVRAPHVQSKNPQFPTLKWFGLDQLFRYGARGKMLYRSARPQAAMAEQESLDEVILMGKAEGVQMDAAASKEMVETDDQNAPPNIEEPSPARDELDVVPRTNLKETVFFFPDMKTDSEGNIFLNFKMNEALTKWKFMAFAHTARLEYVFSEQEIVTSKNLMVFPNAPRFLRQSDQMTFTAKVFNSSDNTSQISAKLELRDALSEELVNKSFGVANTKNAFTVEPDASELLSWNISVPDDYAGLIKYTVLVSDGRYSDGEESLLPTVSNRELVTETFPMNVKGGETKEFVLNAFNNKVKSESLKHHSFTLEYSSNPTWYAIQAMPYLMDYPHQCTEQILNRYFANALASTVANAHPKIRTVFESWKSLDSDALISNLSKNQELKSALLEETPWVLQAKSETEQKKNIALLFDLNRMAAEQTKALSQLRERQNSNGSFSWFPGGRANRYMTQYVVEGLGHLSFLGVTNQNVNSIIRSAIKYLDSEAERSYTELKKRVEFREGDLNEQHISALDVHYLYARSYFLESNPASKEDYYEYYLSQAQKYWTAFNIYEQGMIASMLHRNAKTTTSKEIVKSLKERAIVHDELGRYWKTKNGYHWNHLPIETQSMMIELFQELGEDQGLIDELRIWLLKNKQTNHWKTTKSTASAVYALMLGPGNNGLNSWLLDTKPVAIMDANSKQIEFDNAQSGTLYSKRTYNATEITKELGELTISNSNEVISWGAAYWQYFEDLDKITSFEETPLQLKKSLYKEITGARGSELVEITDKNKLAQGDKLIVRIELRVDRPMEYIHMKDMRASGLEPINVLSHYKYQDGLGYYQSTKDLGTHFFFSYLGKGTYVFEYPLRAVHQGEFSNGITTIQSMYAPEFSSHSGGEQISID